MNQDIPHSASGYGATGSKAGESIKNLSTTAKLAKSKKPNLTKPKESDFAFSGTDFLSSKAKKPSYTYEKLLLKLQFFSILI